MNGCDTVPAAPTPLAVNSYVGRKARCRARYAPVWTDDVKAIRLFADVPEGQLQRLVDTPRQKQVVPHAEMIKEGTESDAFYGLLEGTVEVFSSLDDRETVLDVARRGAALLLFSVIAELPYVASVRALSAARILVIPAAAIHELFDQDKAFARAVACELSRCCYSMVTQLDSLKRQTAMERFADWLSRADALSNGDGWFTVPCGKRTLASLLGMTPESFSRSLRNLVDRGVVAMRGRDARGVKPQHTDCDSWDRRACGHF